MPKVKQQSKVCPSCKLAFHNRKKWQSRGMWDQIIYCSKKCRNNSSQAAASHGSLNNNSLNDGKTNAL